MTEKVVVNEVIKKSETSCVPILVEFQNGDLDNKSMSECDFVLADNKKTNQTEGIFEIKNNIYHGEIKENKDQDSNTYIAVKRGKKIRLIEIDSCTLVHDVHSQQNNMLSLGNNKELAMKILMKNFSGKKSKIYMERTERSKVNVDIIKTQLNKTVDQTVLEEEGEIANEVEILPPINKNASNVDDLYNITEILPEDLLKTLEDEADAVNNFETNNLPISSEFIKNEIARVKNIKNKEELHKLIKVLIYLDGLLNYIKLQKRNVTIAELSKISDKITYDIFKRFSPKDMSKPLRTSISVDKAICYFIVLSILIQPTKEIDANILIREIGRPKRKIISSCTLVRVQKKRNTDILTFTLSSAIAKPRNFKRKTL